MSYKSSPTWPNQPNPLPPPGQPPSQKPVNA